MIDILFAVVIWIVLIVSFFRAWKRDQLRKLSARMMWSIFLCMALAFFFRAESVAVAINQSVNGVPVAFWLKMLSVIIAAYLYLRVLQQVQPPTRDRHEWLGYLSLLVVIANTVALYLGIQKKLTPQQVFYTMMAMSDLLICLYMILMFLPVNLYLLQKERMEPLRLKHIASIVFFAFYIPSAVLTVIFAPVAVMTGYVSPLMYAIPLAPIVFVCIVVQLLPYRYMQKLFYLERLYLYYRLRRLEFTVLTLAGKESQLTERVNLFNEQAVEKATYTALISILDYGNEAAKHSAKGHEIYESVMTATEHEADYSTLVRAIARVAT